MWWAYEWLKKNDAVRPSDRAPASSAKLAMIEAAYSEGQKLVGDFIEYIKEKMSDEKKGHAWPVENTKPRTANGEWKPTGVILYDADLRQLIKDRLYKGERNDKLESALTVKKVARQHGFFPHKDRTRIPDRRVAGLVGLLCSAEGLTRVPPRELMTKIAPLNVTKIATKWENERDEEEAM